MDMPTGDRRIKEWDETDVHNWFSSLGYPQYESQIRANTISGDVLCMLDSEQLKDMGIATIGQRLAILKAVYLVKIAHNVPIESDHYVPPSEVSERVENISLDGLYSVVKDQAQRIHTLEEDNRNLNGSLQSLVDELTSIRNSLTRPDDVSSPLHRQPSFKWAQFVKPQTSPTKPEHPMVESPHPSPQQLEHDIPPLGRNPGPSQLNPNAHASTSSAEKHRPPPVTIAEPTTSGPSPGPPKPHRQESSENLNKSFKVTLDDPTWKVLPAALKKYRINNDNWQNYAMFICYGSAGNRIERCLSYDEKPLLLFQKLKDAKKNPVFMLKHIKDIRSPIAVAQQKHAARKASSIITNDSSITSATHGHAHGHGHAKSPSTSRPVHRLPRLEVQDLSTPSIHDINTHTPMALGLSPQPGWPEPSILSPAVDTAGSGRGDDASHSPGSQATRSSTASTSTVASTATNMSGTTVTGSNEGHARTTSDTPEQPLASAGNGTIREVPLASNAVSYAVAIYPYMAEQDDEFDVVVGDTFVILSRARGWWIVQRDPTGSGIVEPDKQGWVPAGCLLETNVPVASAIAEATAAKVGGGSKSGTSPPETPISKTPILPLSIISTSFPGVALMDYSKKGDEELDLVKDDALRVFKRYNHWSYAVKEDGGDRGWVPSWFIGKLHQPGNVPPTPSSSNPSHLHSMSEDANQSQVSPMSSAFPAVQTRLTVPI
ncbi:hypothetical protein DXG03_007831 [Asterophora parasitica]|uniref:Protein kinase regulator n=1 Tax=Asterophora parasitica TaxID=117018 RepID=A0A9P7GJ33_9AGAR|nr:hypothetical protein DXG03_007831 [Asterophora parasitica]